MSDIVDFKSVKIAIPRDLHPATASLVCDFAEALAQKLRADEIKHGFTNEWAKDLWEDQCRNDLFRHLLKGDPREVAAYCAFMWKRGWRTVSATMDMLIARSPERAQ